jgi:hypothetical protein
LNNLPAPCDASFGPFFMTSQLPFWTWWYSWGAPCGQTIRFIIFFTSVNQD